MSKQTMQAIRVHQFGGPEQLKLEQVPRPEPQSGELLIRVHAAGILPADVATCQGRFLSKSFPYIPGTAFAGVIEELGANVSNFQKGQAVCGRAPNGTYAEYTTVLATPPALTSVTGGNPPSAAIIPLALKPKTLTFDEAATLSGGATQVIFPSNERCGHEIFEYNKKYPNFIDLIVSRLSI